MSPSATVVLLVHAAIAAVVIAGAVVLLALHDLDQSTAIALIGIGVTLVGGSAAAIGYAAAAPAGTSVIDSGTLSKITSSATTKPAGWAQQMTDAANALETPPPD